MKERPIVFSTPMIHAILNGCKTQTRRVVTPQPYRRGPFWVVEGQIKLMGSPVCSQLDTNMVSDVIEALEAMGCPQGKVGQRLWVRETMWRNGGYVADGPSRLLHDGKVPSIYMARRQSRIDLEITETRVERLQEISTNDCRAEGVSTVWATNATCGEFVSLWNSINEKRGFGWETNPFVWKIGFRRLGRGK